MNRSRIAIRFWLLVSSLLVAPALFAVVPVKSSEAANDFTMPAVCTWYIKQDYRLMRCGPDNYDEAEVAVHVASIEAPVSRPVKRTSPVAKRGYLVASIGATDAVLAKLRELKEKHFIVLNSPPYMNRVSFGIYNGISYALRRQAHLMALGIASELINRSPAAPQQLVAADDTTASDVIMRHDDPPTKPIMDAPRQQSAEPEPKNPNEAAKKLITLSQPDNGKARRGYLVAAIGDPDVIVAQLTILRVKDFIVLKQGPYGKRVSLGIYNGVDYALRRQTQLHALGISSELIDRSISYPRQIDTNIQVAATSQDLDTNLESIHQELEREREQTLRGSTDSDRHEPTSYPAAGRDTAPDLSAAGLLASSGADEPAPLFAAVSSLTGRMDEPTQLPAAAILAKGKANEPGQLFRASDNTTTSFMVATVGDVESALSILALAKDRDFFILRHRPYANRVSLGVFSKMENAQRRQASLQRLGIRSELIDRSEAAADRAETW